MSQYSHSVKNLINGVSQQDSSIKLDNQVEEQINLIPDITFGLNKRNPVKFLDKIKNQSFKDRVTFSFKYLNSNREEEKCLFLIPNLDSEDEVNHVSQIYRISDGKIFTLKNTLGSSTIAYLANADKKDLVFVEDGSSVYILNKNIKVVTKTNPDYPTLANTERNAIVWLANASYAESFNVKINWRHTASNTTGTSTVSCATHPSASSTGGGTVSPDLSSVAIVLSSAIGALTHAGNPLFTCTQSNNVVLINPNFGTIESMDVTDDRANNDIRYALNAQRYDFFLTDPTRLPRGGAVEGFKVRITPDPSSATTTYILKKKGDSWVETSTEATTVIDATTFVHKFIKADLNTLENDVTLSPLDFTKRPAGESESNPEPSFLNKSLNDLFLFNSRLGVATDDTLVLSAINEFSTFYKTTTAYLRTDDRVDVTLDSSKINYSTIKNVSTVNGQPLINTRAFQAILVTNTAFDMTKSRLVEASAYNLGDFKPVAVGNQLYFAVSNDNGFTNLHNYQVDPVSGTSYVSEQLDKHCSNYIKGKIRQIQYYNNTTLITTEDDLKTIYVQHRYTKSNELVQNAFSKWTLPFDVEYIDFIDDLLYIVMVKDEDTNIIGSMDILINKEFVYKKPIYDTFTMTIQEDNDYINNGLVTINWYNTDVVLRADEMNVADLETFFMSGIFTGTNRTVTVTEMQAGSDILPKILKVQLNGFDSVEPVRIVNNYLNRVSSIEPRTFTLRYTDNTEDTESLSIGYKPYMDLTLPYVDTDLSLSVIAINNQLGYKYSNLTEAQESFDDVGYGIPFTASIVLPRQLPRKKTTTGYDLLSFGKLFIRRFNFLVNNTGTFKVDVTLKHRGTTTYDFSPNSIGGIILGVASITERIVRSFITGHADDITIKVYSDNTEPFNLVGFEWLGTILNKGRRF